jgi:lysophospholipase L1-like esterase
MTGRRFLLAASALLPLLGSVAAHARVVLAATPISRMDLPWWKKRFEQKAAELHARKVHLVFYGDSIMQYWEHKGPPEWENFAPIWRAYYGDRDAVDLGFTGDTTANLLWRIEHGEAEGIAPRAAVILIGANNLGRLHWSAQDTVEGINAIVQQLRQKLPDTKLLLLSVLPSDRGEWVARTGAEVNRVLAAEYGKGRVEDVTFLDVSGLFLHGGRVDKADYLDPLMTPPRAALHPSPEAAARLAAAIEPTLAHMLGDRVHHMAQPQG